VTLKKKAFLEGMARSIDLFGVYPRAARSETSRQRTRRSFRVVAVRISQANEHQLALRLSSRILEMGDRVGDARPSKPQPASARVRLPESSKSA